MREAGPSVAEQRKADRARRKARRDMERRELLPAIRDAVKGSGWRQSQGVLFREIAGWFVIVDITVQHSSDLTTVRAKTKPMAIDPLFWDIVQIDDNNTQPLSFRVFGAFTAPAPVIAEAELSRSNDALEIARAGLRWVQAFVADFDPNATRALVDAVVTPGAPLSRHYTATQVCLLILDDRHEEARAFSEGCRERGEGGGFTNLDLRGASFHDMAIRWLDRLKADAGPTLGRS